ncbi:MAG: SpoIID/LytB domain-containing protein [Epulopiscium sp.]|nr:SpoIID/LytB domain-containing protein [Candidatus Epulonipiscium sp.]
MRRVTRQGIVVFFIFIVLGFYFPTKTQALLDMPKWIRVGLEYKYKNANSINIKNQEILLGYDIKEEFIPVTILKSDRGFSMVPTQDYFISINQEFNTYEEAVLLAEGLRGHGLEAFPVGLSYSTWYVYIGGFSSYKEAEAIKHIVNMESVIKEPDSTRMLMKNNNEIIAVFESRDTYPQISGVGSKYSEEIVELGDRKYRGRVEFRRDNGSGITAVNVILLEEYLYGVVPSEMPPSWNMEALKAQAVVARNYAILNMKKHQNSGYMCDGEHCQVYKGYDNENPNTNRAVDETYKELLYYDNEIVEAFYFARSGGYTEDSENVWVAPLPYLRAVMDPYEDESYTWTRAFDKEQVGELLRNNGKDIGSVMDIQINSYTPGGRVEELTIIGTGGSERLTKESTRTFFKTNGISLESRMFEIIKEGASTSETPSLSIIGENQIAIQNINFDGIYTISADGGIEKMSLTNSSIKVQGKDGTKDISFISLPIRVDGDFVFRGKGQGHGVGMSQWGAKGMADNGYNYRQILSHYFTGTSVR